MKLKQLCPIVFKNYNQTYLSKKLLVSRQTISTWFNTETDNLLPYVYDTLLWLEGRMESLDEELDIYYKKQMR